LWIAREAKKDPRERKKLPEDPMLSMSKTLSKTSTTATTGTTNGDIDIEELNRLATATFNTETLETCNFCGRTFLAEKLKIHNRSCTSDNPARKVSENVKRGNISKLDIIVEPRAVTANSTLRSSKQTSSGNTDSDVNTKFGKTLKKADAAVALACEVEDDEEAEEGEVDSMSLGSTINLQVQNGSLALVGHLSGPAGRSLRKQTAGSPSPSTSLNSSLTSSSFQQQLRPPSSQPRPQLAPEAIRALQDKQEVVEYLQDNISFMENTALGLMHSINDMKSLLEELRGGGKL